MELIEQVDQMLRKYNYQDKVIWGSFNNETTTKCQIVNHEVSRFQSRQEFFKVLILYYLGLLPFWKLEFQSFQAPYPNDGFLATQIGNPDRKHFVKFFKYYYWFIKRTVSPLLKHLEKRGIQVILWVVNEEDNLNDVFKYKIDGIMTDEPTKFIQIVKNM